MIVSRTAHPRHYDRPGRVRLHRAFACLAIAIAMQWQPMPSGPPPVSISYLLVALSGLFTATPALAQEGVIASVYDRERGLLKKMWKARQEGNQDEVDRLSAELKVFVAERKSWAAGFLTLTDNSIAELEGAAAPGLDPAERARLVERRRVIEAEIRVLELMIEKAVLAYQHENHRDRIENDRAGKLLGQIEAAAQKAITGLQERVAEQKELLFKIKVAQNKFIEAGQAEVKRLEAIVFVIREDCQKVIEDLNSQMADTDDRISRIRTAGFEADAAMNRSLEEMKKRREDLEAETRKLGDLMANGEYAASAAGRMTENSVKAQIETQQALMMEANDKMARGEFGVPELGYISTNSVNGVIETYESEIASIKTQTANGTYGPPELGRISRRAVEGQIADREKAMAARRELFTAEKWRSMGDLRRQMEALEIEAATLDARTGSADEKVRALQARKKEIERFLAHDFVTELPEEESAFMKTLRWCADAASEVLKVADRVREATQKFERVRQIVDIVKTASNPAQAADRLLKAATGKGFVETIGEKLLPAKVLENPLVRSFLKGERVDRAALVESAAREGLSKEVTDAYDTLTRLRDDPEGFLRSNLRDKVENIIDGNPRLKKTFETMREARRVIENPELIEEKLRDNVEAYAKAKEKLERIRAEGLDAVENFENNVAAGVARAVENAVEHRLGIVDGETDFTRGLVEGYEYAID